MEIPEIAIRWIVECAANNLELASFSNVCKRWRDIAIDVVLEQGRRALLSEGEQCSFKLLLLPSMVRFLLCREKSIDHTVESFCIAWFHPDGIDIKQVSPGVMSDSSDEYESNERIGARAQCASPEPFAPSGWQSYTGSGDEGKHSRRNRRGRSRSPSAFSGSGVSDMETADTFVSCMYQWHGYRYAVEVLQPFGFSSRFVHKVIELAKSSLDEPDEKESDGKTIPEYYTFAVRGATLARPEGYCLCWDAEHQVSDSQCPRSVSAAVAHEPERCDGESREFIKTRNRRRKQLHQEVLPRVISSTPYKNTADMSRTSNRQPCIQFLNFDGSHAVRLFTPRFRFGPYPTPITIFCVGIATEDGCFLSGLSHRFELGHLYPESACDNLAERSSICICTDPVQTELSRRPSAADMYRQYADESFNSDDSSYEMGGGVGDGRLRCQCQFANLDDSASVSSDDTQVRQIYRGRRGPGAWHCYVALFDGDSSVIRIDGVPELLRPSNRDKEMQNAALDGLTIGADHTFDMSLCFGQGSDGEGEGAMSELIVFKGSMDLSDIRVLEQHLMTKHGIPVPVLSEGGIIKEDLWTRQAHGMITNIPRHPSFCSETNRIPLRLMARHRQVAWRQVNAVSGDAIKIKKIGTKFGDSSSDW